MHKGLPMIPQCIRTGRLQRTDDIRIIPKSPDTGGGKIMRKKLFRPKEFGLFMRPR